MLPSGRILTCPWLAMAAGPWQPNPTQPRSCFNSVTSSAEHYLCLLRLLLRCYFSLPLPSLLFPSLLLPLSTPLHFFPHNK
ncbi:hypothetical protein B0H12DRAFT_518389 [Mycena haematopus]|nr:hypothetical protein B0H12DRAFT_518389 [Mycena haematopus]